MNTLTHSSKKRFPFALVIGLGMLLLPPGFSLADQNHAEVKSEMAKSAQITIEQAIETAKKDVPGTVIKAELEKEHGPLMWEIEIQTSEGKVKEVHLDGTTGKRLAFQSGEGYEQKSDSTIHAGSADSGSHKMEGKSSEKVNAEEPSQEKKP
ncbi:MAG: PepSY domain-containing protein [Nitrospirales bacterium]